MPRAMSASARVPNDWTTTRLLCRTRELYALDNIAHYECAPFHLDDNAVTFHIDFKFSNFRLCKSKLVSPIEESAPLRQVERKEVNTHIDGVRGSFDVK